VDLNTAQLLSGMLALLVGAVIGGLGGVFGVGAGVIAIPALTMLFGMHQQLAQGTALLMMLPNVLVAFWRYWQHTRFSLQSALWIGLTTIVATYPAAHVALLLDSHLLKLAFSVFLVTLALHSLYVGRSDRSGNSQAAHWDDRYLPIVGVAGGIIAGLFAAGAGVIAATIFANGFGKRQTVAQGLALALVVPGTIAALSGYAQAGQVDWRLGLPLALGALVTVSSGVNLAHKLPERYLRKLFALLMLATALLMLAQAIQH
jgi:uncharacterized membrane protein YfcA